MEYIGRWNKNSLPFTAQPVVALSYTYSDGFKKGVIVDYLHSLAEDPFCCGRETSRVFIGVVKTEHIAICWKHGCYNN